MERFSYFFGSIDTERWVWVLAMLVGLSFFMAGVFYLISRRGRRESHYARAAILEFIACWALYIPRELYCSEHACTDQILHVIESVFTALLGSLNIYLGDGYQRMNYEGHALFSSLYGIVRVFANIALVVFVGGFILKFLNGPLQHLKLWWCQRRYLYVFSTCNEKTLTIAGSIPDGQKQTEKPGKTEKTVRIRKRKKLIVFACGDSAAAPEYRERIEAFGGLYIDSTATDVVRKYAARAAGIEVFLFDEEEQNLSQLENICSALEQKQKNHRIRIMAELSDTPWDLYDNYPEKYGLKDRDVIVNFVRIEECFVYSDLLKHSIFEHAAAAEDRKEIRALLVGPMNARNLEMFKALLHLSQMPGYFLKLRVLDPGAGRSRLKQLMPEVGDDGPGEGDAVYQLDYQENVDCAAGAFEEKVLAVCPDFTFAFVNAGDDLLNISLALQLKAMAARKGRGEADYRLQVSLVSREICGKWNQELCKGIEPVGSTEAIYSYQFVINSDIEQASEKIHLARHRSTRWESYLNKEYDRHSVFARTLSYKYKVQLLGDRYYLAGSAAEIAWDTREELEQKWGSLSSEEKTWKIYEHMRWDMYTRTLGYRADSGGLLTALAAADQDFIFKIREKELEIKQAEQKLSENEEKLKQLKAAPARKESAAQQEELQQLAEEQATLAGLVKTLSKEKDALKKQKEDNWKQVKAIRNAARIHNDLVPFDQLPLTEQIKDNLTLTDEVVAALRKI